MTVQRCSHLKSKNHAVQLTVHQISSCVVSIRDFHQFSPKSVTFYFQFYSEKTVVDIFYAQKIWISDIGTIYFFSLRVAPFVANPQSTLIKKQIQIHLYVFMSLLNRLRLLGAFRELISLSLSHPLFNEYFTAMAQTKAKVHNMFLCGS